MGRVDEKCPGCAVREAIERSVRGRPAAATRFAQVVLVAQDLAVQRRADRVEAQDLERAAELVRREVSA